MRAQLGRHGGAGRLLDDLLVPPLHGSRARRGDRVALHVGKHLQLDMARVQRGALDQQIAVAKPACASGARRSSRLAATASRR
jgi:hypothetical protein